MELELRIFWELELEKTELELCVFGAGAPFLELKNVKFGAEN